MSRPIDLSAEGGTLVFVALPADNYVKLPIFETVFNGITVKGSIVGNRVDLAEHLSSMPQGEQRLSVRHENLRKLTMPLRKSRAVTRRVV